MPKYVGGPAIERLIEENRAYRQAQNELNAASLEWLDRHLDLAYEGRRDARTSLTLSDTMVWQRR